MRVFFIFLLLCSTVVYSNDYHIEDIAVSFNISRDVLSKLKKNNIVTTKIFLEKNKDKKMLLKNSKVYNISLLKLKNLYSKFSLMKIKGIGPKVSKLLFKSGIKSLKQLKNSDLKKLEKDLIKVNKKYHYSDFTPNIKNLKSWVKQINE